MKNRLVEILRNLNLSQDYDVIGQGELDTYDEIPLNYFTFSIWDNARSGFYDNKHTKNHVGIQIIAYSTDETFVEEMSKRAVKELEKNDFIIQDDPTDYPTTNKDYTAQIVDNIYFIKNKEE